MSAITPVPTSRNSDPLTYQRFLSQVQGNQLDMLNAQVQLGSGRRILRPSDDGPAAQRAITLQRLLEQKKQTLTNLSTGSSFLAATDAALGDVSASLVEVHGLALGMVGTVGTNAQRDAAIQQVNAAIDHLVQVGNKEFRGRYLFAGSNTELAPYEKVGEFIRYSGNLNELHSYGDAQLLFASNIPGAGVFGGGVGIYGAVDLNPTLTETTNLDAMRGGLGVARGSIAVSDGNSTSVIDIGTAATIKDIVRLIEANPPEGREIVARIDHNRLTLELTDGLGGNLTVREVGAGTTAAELGIFEHLGVGEGPLLGKDLNPRLTMTTSIENLLGTKAGGVLAASGSNNDLLISAKQNGPAYNGVAVQYVDDSLLDAGPSVVAGSEYLVYSDAAVAARAALTLPGADNDLVLVANVPGVAMNNVRVTLVGGDGLGDAANVTFGDVAGVPTLSIQIDDVGPDATTLDTLVGAINANGQFTAIADPSAGDAYNGSAIIENINAGGIHTTTGNSGGEAGTLFIHVEDGATTAAHVVAAAEADPVISAMFDIQLDEKDTTTTLVAGQGMVDLSATVTLAGGSGEVFDQSSGISITNGNDAYTVMLDDVETVEQLLNKLNFSGADIRAEINAAGNGINITSLLMGADLSIGENGGTTASQLGIRTFNRETALSSLNYGAGVSTTTGPDLVIQRSDGVSFDVDVSSALTIGDVIDEINNHVDNQPPANGVAARLAEFGNGIELIDNAGGAQTLTVERAFGSEAAWDLGLVPVGLQQAAAAAPGSSSLLSRDVAPVEPAGVFNTLLRLNRALESNDISEISRQTAALKEDVEDFNIGRAQLGARQQGLDALMIRLEDEEVELQSVLSEEIDLDLVEAVSRLTTLQSAYEASLRLMAQLTDLTLLHFL
jgi:flagellar hook-associated protein 3 FlgL